MAANPLPRGAKHAHTATGGALCPSKPHPLKASSVELLQVQPGGVGLCTSICSPVAAFLSCCGFVCISSAYDETGARSRLGLLSIVAATFLACSGRASNYWSVEACPFSVLFPCSCRIVGALRLCPSPGVFSPLPRRYSRATQNARVPRLFLACPELLELSKCVPIAVPPVSLVPCSFIALSSSFWNYRPCCAVACRALSRAFPVVLRLYPVEH